jgi:hypothetical protein
MSKQENANAFHIFVNRKKFEEPYIKNPMTGAEIASLVGVPDGNAVVRRDTGPDKGPIGLTESTSISLGDHFIVTRKNVDGGHAS